MDLLNLYQTKYKDKVNISYNDELELYTVKYLHAGVDFSDPLLAMARGLTFDKNNKIILRGFEKFFNYLQLHAPYYQNVYSEEWINQHDNFEKVDPDYKYAVIEKLDGSMVLMGSYRDSYIFASTSSTHSHVVEIAYNYFSEKSELAEKLKHYSKENNVTLIFEYVSPKNEIAVKYNKDDFVLIGIIKNESGYRYTEKELDEFAKIHNLTRPKTFYMTLNELVNSQETLEGFEGFVVENESRHLLKFKTNYWFENKRTSDLFFGYKITERKVKTIIDAYLNDEIDDLFARQNQNNVFKSENLIGKVVDEIKKLENRFNEIYKNTNKDLDNKSLFEMYDATTASLITRLRQGKSIFSKTTDGRQSIANKWVINSLKSKNS